MLFCDLTGDSVEHIVDVPFDTRHWGTNLVGHVRKKIRLYLPGVIQTNLDHPE